MGRRGITVGSLFTGFGGVELGLRAAGVAHRVEWYAENDQALVPMLARAYPRVPNYGDVRPVDWRRVEGVELVTAGFPCQPVSTVGRRAGEADARWMWPTVRDVARHIRPDSLFIENVRNLIAHDGGRLFASVCTDLRRLGYSVRWMVLGACHVDLAHHRHRVFILARLGHRHEVRQVPMSTCGVNRDVALLPTPTARDGVGRGTGDARFWTERRARRDNGIPLDSAVALLPQPRGRSLDHFGRFAPAVVRQAQALGKPPPATESNTVTGAPRLHAPFVEWLMALPAGYVTDALPRLDALRAIGNGVCPPQAARAWALLDAAF